MTDIGERIEALEKRVAALESKEQAPQSELSMSPEEIAKVAIEVINRQTLKSGKQRLLL